MKFARLFPVFSAAFAAIYAPTMYYNWAVFTYQPATMEWDWGPVIKQGPPMFWYGWLVTSFVGACVVAALAALVPERIARRVWPGLTWLVPVAVLAFIAYILRPYYLN
jgi:hypothetical protein